MEVIKKKKKGTVREYTEALLTALLVAFFVRSFVVEAFKIPSGSMIPTLMIGDHIFVNKFTYGLRIPFTKKKIVDLRTPERGEAVVFMYPSDNSKDFIKRVIGLPGDKVSLQGDQVLINGEPLQRVGFQVEPTPVDEPKSLKVPTDAFSNSLGIDNISVFPGWEKYSYAIEKTGEVKHVVQFDSLPPYFQGDVEVPAGHLFVMGDNRDNSSDSREWGFVPMENVKGKAMFVWLSIDYDRKTLRWDRFGKWIN